MPISIRPTGRVTFMRLVAYQEIDCLIIIKLYNLIKKSDIEIKKLYNKV